MVQFPELNNNPSSCALSINLVRFRSWSSQFSSEWTSLFSHPVLFPCVCFPCFYLWELLERFRVPLSLGLCVCLRCSRFFGNTFSQRPMAPHALQASRYAGHWRGFMISSAVAAFAFMCAFSMNFFGNLRHFLELCVSCCYGFIVSPFLYRIRCRITYRLS